MPRAGPTGRASRYDGGCGDPRACLATTRAYRMFERAAAAAGIPVTLYAL